MKREAKRALDRAYHRTPKRRYLQTKLRALKRNQHWDLTFRQYLSIMQNAVCEYCKGPTNVTGSGLDRIINNIGYTPTNVVPCCVQCNSIKGVHLSYEEAKVALAAVAGLRESKKK